MSKAAASNCAVYPESRLREAHGYSFKNARLVSESDECACFYCLNRFKPGDVYSWCDNSQTALCPRCCVDSVLPGRYADDFLVAMKRFWFKEVTR